MKKLLLPLLVFLVLLFPPVVFAHPGRTAADGCHYCRTNCDYWGVPWNVRHCHGGTVQITPEYSALKTEPTLTPAGGSGWLVLFLLIAVGSFLLIRERKK